MPSRCWRSTFRAKAAACSGLTSWTKPIGRKPQSPPTTLVKSRKTSHRTWDRLREMYRLTGQYSSYPKISDLREEIKLALPKVSSKPRGGNSARA